MRSSGCMAALPSSWRRCRYQSPLRGGRSGTASSTSSTLEGIGRPSDAMPGRRGLRGATGAASLLCSTRRRLPRLLMQFARRSSRSPHPILERALWPGCSTWNSKLVKTLTSCDFTHGQARLMPRPRYATCPVETRCAPPPQMLVGSCAHIDSPTAITPTVTSAIQVRSLLFSANQSAIDAYAALLSLVLCPCMDSSPYNCLRATGRAALARISRDGGSAGRSDHAARTIRP